MLEVFKMSVRRYRSKTRIECSKTWKATFVRLITKLVKVRFSDQPVSAKNTKYRQGAYYEWNLSQ